ncbi:tRNA 4-thiouridine(8) synthase ThiI [Mycoplasmatota bacterium]|nr:tRNA 4-thiouridine(8) synthase ThiI [Mycoplasmatota bacterium]
MYDRILIRYGELTLKGKNKKDFINRVYQMVRDKCNDLEKISFDKRHDRLYIILNGEKYTNVVERLNKVFGLHSYSLVATTSKDMNDIKKLALELSKSIKEEKTFKVETKRSDKRYPLTSMDITKEVAAYVLQNTDNYKVKMKNPDVKLYIEIRQDSSYLYFDKTMGLGGLPIGVSGKGMLLLSGGIDSPVAGFLTMKRGMEVEGIHFESTPLTPIESAQKVVELTKKMAEYAPNRGIKVHFVPFKDLHMKILEKVNDSYKITIMRRMMFRISEKLAKKFGSNCLITGESLGQVASQTIESINSINDVVNIPVLRPLISMDKSEIVKISKNVNTYDISIRPFEDCCTVYVPSKPVTKPKIEKCIREEIFDYESMVDWCVENTQTAVIKTNSSLDLPKEGFEVKIT